MVLAASRGRPSFQLADHAGEIVEHAVGKLLLAYLVPDVFLRVEFWRIRRQAQQANILRDHQVLRHMRAGVIQSNSPSMGLTAP